MSECQDCTAGDYCDVEGLNATAGPCPDGYYCPVGTGDRYSHPCGIGYYRQGGARESSGDCSACKSGYYCPTEGLAQGLDCPRGFYCDI